MIRGQTIELPPRTHRPDYGAVGAVAVLAYFVILGDLGWRDMTIARLISGVLAAGLVLMYVARAPGRADRFDRGILLALIVFSVAGVFSQFPRQSFDSVLAVLLYASALFLARGVLARESARRLFVIGLMALSALLTVIITAQLIAPFFEWWTRTDWSVFPPLDLKILPKPWISRYELILLLLLLYPSWWIGRVSGLRATAAVSLGILIVIACLIAGSRNIWLAAGAGVAVIVPPVVRHGFRGDLRRLALIAAVVGLVITALLLSGLGGALTERVFRLAPLAERGSTWGPLLELWAERPLVGYGPGSFPWLLRLTDYFDTNSVSPRTPDSTVIQLVVESGLMGVVAALTVLATVMPAVFRGRSRAARFALVACLSAGVGLNPAESAAITAMAIAWVAYAAPREPPAELTGPSPQPARFRALSIAGLGLLGIAFMSTVVADLAYRSARGAIEGGDYRAAAPWLELATRLDPGLAIYARQLGTLRLISGEPEAAITALEEGVAVNPTDDLAWRTLGLARSEAGDWSGSRTAFERAVAVHRSDPTNLLLLARLLQHDGDQAAAEALMAEIVQAWPFIVAAPGWQEFAISFSTSQVLHLAHDRWTDGLPSPESLFAQPLLLGVLIGLDDVDLQGEPARLTPTLKKAYVAVMRCDPNAAEALSAAPKADRRTATYWALAVRLAQLDGIRPQRSERLYRIMTGDTVMSSHIYPRLNPLYENSIRGSSADTWGYRRSPIDWPDTAWDLPSPRSGFARWHNDPGGAVREAGLTDILSRCR